MTTTKEKNTATAFSYNKLIWPVFILLVLLIFKNPIEKLLLGSDDVAVEVLGVKIQIAKSAVDELSVIQQEFDAEIRGLKDTIHQQNLTLIHLEKLNEELESKAKSCPDVKEATEQFSKDVAEIRRSNKALQSKAVTFGKKSIVKIPKEEKDEKKEEKEE